MTVSRHCEKDGCECERFKTKVDENNKVVYDKRLEVAQ